MTNLKDSRGVPIRVGQKVAYNRSGSVVTGEVVEVASRAIRVMPDRIFWQKKWNPHTRQYEVPQRVQPSRVMNSHSILVLEQP